MPSRRYKKVFTTLNYIEYFLILASAVTGRISISNFASFLGIPIGIANSAKRFETFAITQECVIVKYQILSKSKKLADY